MAGVHIRLPTTVQEWIIPPNLPFKTFEDNIPKTPFSFTNFPHITPEKIIASFCDTNGTRHYRVKWMDSWLTESHVTSAFPSLYTAYWLSKDNTDYQSYLTSGSKSPTKTTRLESPPANTDLLNNPSTELKLPEKLVEVKTSDKKEKKDGEMTFYIEKEGFVPPETNVVSFDNPLQRLISNAQFSIESQLQQNLQQEEINNIEDNTIFKKSPKKSKPVPKEKTPVNCDICGKTISSKKNLRVHKTVKHFKNGSFVCEICGRKFALNRDLKRHMPLHTNERNYECPHCGMKCKQPGHLTKHMRTHTEVMNWRCDCCFKNFRVQSDLKEHCFSEHSNIKDKNLTCSVCKEKLKLPNSVYLHSLRHSGVREFHCEICKASFKLKQHMQVHMKTHNKEIQKKTFQCAVCQMRFHKNNLLDAHMAKHKKNEAKNDGELVLPKVKEVDERKTKNDEERPNYKCDTCGDSFRIKSLLNSHLKLHVKEENLPKVSIETKKKIDFSVSKSEEVTTILPEKSVEVTVMPEEKNDEVTTILPADEHNYTSIGYTLFANNTLPSQINPLNVSSAILLESIKSFVPQE